MGDLRVKIPKRNAYHPSKMITIPYEDFKIVEVGKYFHAIDTTANLGGETGNMIHLVFTTPAATEIICHVGGFCSTAAAVFTFMEAPTAGGTGSGASAASICLNRGTRKETSGLTILKDTTTITSGGITLHTEIIAAGNRSANEDHLWCLAASTKYSITMYLAAAGVSEVNMHWYERVLKA